MGTGAAHGGMHRVLEQCTPAANEQQDTHDQTKPRGVGTFNWPPTKPTTWPLTVALRNLSRHMQISMTIGYFCCQRPIYRTANAYVREHL
jgi:hypothetical protein